MTEIKRISFSELKNWKECPYRHKLIYKDKIPHFEGNEYTAFGTAIHSVCEKVIPLQSNDAKKVFAESFEKELSILKEQGKTLNDGLVSDMWTQASPICEQVLPAVKAHFGNFTVVSVEEELLEPISEFNSYGTSGESAITNIFFFSVIYNVPFYKICNTCNLDDFLSLYLSLYL